MRTALKLYDIYGIFTFLYSLAKRFFTDTRKDAYSTETIRHIRHLYVSLQLSKNDSLRIRVKMRTALKLYDIYGIFTFLYSLAKRFFTDTRKDAYSTETIRHIRHLYVSLQLSKTILYGYA